jgi:ABC-2 type transport system permease protein
MSVDVQGFTDPGLWSSVWKLLRLRAVIFISGFRRAKLRRKIGTIVLILLVLGLIAFIFSLSWLLLRFLRSPGLAQYVGDVTPLMESVPVLLIGGAFLGILITSFGVLLQALYLANDMEFLLSAPLPLRSVFLSKLLQAILPNFSLICLFALPVLYGLGLSNGYNILFFPLVLLMLAALALAAAGISSLLVMLVVRIFPARRVAELLGFIGAILSFVCSQSGNLARFDNFSGQQASQALTLITRFNQPWSPLAWAGRGLVDLGSGRWFSGIGFSVLTLGLAFGVFGAALTISEKLYYSGWASMQSRQQKKKAQKKTQSEISKPWAILVQRSIPAEIRAIFVKDLLSLRRDLRNMSQLVTPLIFGIVYGILFLRNGGELSAGRGEAPRFFIEILKNLSLYGNVAISLFVGWMLVARLGMTAFSMEGKNYWLLKSAPISAGQMIISKFLVAYLPSLAMGWAFLLVISVFQRAAPLMILFTLFVVALCIAGNVGVNLTFGIAGANLNWDDPRHMQRGTASCFGSLVTLLYLPLSLILFFGPPLGFSLLEWPDWIGQLVGLVIGGVFCLVCAIVPLYSVRARLLRLGEE